MNRITRLTAVLFLLSISGLQAEDERILSFHSDITVQKDSSLLVTETIRVRALGLEIKRGIYRDFPTRYKDHAGRRVVVGFQVLDVRRDNAPEAYHLQSQSNGERVYLGQQDVFLSHEEHTYTLTYTTTRQLGFFPEHDELYWNVTGNAWSFPIDEASATVSLPEGVAPEKISLQAYTGPQGAKGGDFRSSIDSSGRPTFETTKSLNPGEGLTIAVLWPKGFVREPSQTEKWRTFSQDNKSLMLGILGLLIVFGYYSFIWFRHGRDPQAGAIIPLFEPPAGFSPAAMRYIQEMGYDQKVFTAAILNMAVKGFLTITEKGETYSIQRKADSLEGLEPDERKIANALLPSKTEFKFTQTHHAEISQAILDFRQLLKTNYEKTHFVTNIGYFSLGLILSLAFLIASALPLMDGDGSVGFLLIWLTFWSIGVIVLVCITSSLWRDRNWGRAFTMTLFSSPFVFAELFVLHQLAQQTSLGIVGLLAALVAINVFFYQWLKAPTLLGRRLMDKIEGFKLFLSVAEKDEMNWRNPPEKTPKLFEKYLPYALALGVEQLWSEKFAKVLAQAEQGPSGSGYQPGWYSGSSFRSIGAGAFASSLGHSLSNAISSSSAAPGSSSGGGGGGSSGGGGGGGGGGGW